MLPKPKRLHKQRDYMKLAVKGHPIFGLYFTLRIMPAKNTNAKIGFITSTKVMKLSVDRNRAKRRMREIVREIYAEFPSDMFFAFILKPEVKTVPFETLREEVRRMILKVPEALARPAKVSSRGKKVTTKFAQQKKTS